MPRRILLLITDLKIGGTPTVVRELTLRLRHEPDVIVHVACLDAWGPVADELRSAGVVVTAFAAKGRADARVIFKLARLIHRQSYDTVLSFLMHANAIAAAARLMCRKVRFFQSIQTTQAEPSWHWKVQSIAQHAAEKVIVPSKSVADVAHTWAHVPEEKIAIIPNAIDIRDFAAIARRPPAEEVRRIGFIGRLDPIKRIGDLIEAMTHLDERFTLDIYGTGAEQSAIESQIKEQHPTGRVKLRGGVSRPEEALTEIDVLVLPSDAEGFGLVLIEAMAAGVPVVATDVPGIRDVVKNEQTGLLVPVASPRALSKAIWRISSDETLQRSLVQAGKADVAEHYSWPPVIEQYRQLLGLS